MTDEVLDFATMSGEKLMHRYTTQTAIPRGEFEILHFYPEEWARKTDTLRIGLDLTDSLEAGQFVSIAGHDGIILQCDPDLPLHYTRLLVKLFESIDLSQLQDCDRVLVRLPGTLFTPVERERVST